MRISFQVTASGLKPGGAQRVSPQVFRLQSAKPKLMNLPSQVSDALERYVRDGVVPKPIRFGFLKFSGFGLAAAFACKGYFDLGCFSAGLGYFLGGILGAAFFHYVLSPFKPLWNRMRGPEARIRSLCADEATFTQVVKPMAMLWSNVMDNVVGVKARMENYQEKIKALDREKTRESSLFVLRGLNPELKPEENDPYATLRDQVIPDIQTFFEAASQATLAAKKLLIDTLSTGQAAGEEGFERLRRELDRLANFDEREQYPRVFSDLGDPQLGV